jgi:hypothetical protein
MYNLFVYSAFAVAYIKAAEVTIFHVNSREFTKNFFFTVMDGKQS